jgi:hypothetical protein
MAQRDRDDELYGLDLQKLATVPPRPGFERAALALLPEGSQARWNAGAPPQVALPGGPWRRYRHDGQTHASTSDPREAWELLYSRGVIDRALFEELPSRCVARCSQCGSRRSSVRCDRCRGALWTPSGGPASVLAALWIASAAAELRAAEQLVAECYARLRPWGFRGIVPTLYWSFEAVGGQPNNADRVAIRDLGLVSWRSVDEEEGYALLDRTRRAMRGGAAMPIPRGHRPWIVEDVGDMLLYDLAARQGLVSKDNPAYAIPVHRSVVGVAFAAHPNPFEPLVRVNTLGFYVDTLDESRAVIVGLYDDGRPSA